MPLDLQVRLENEWIILEPLREHHFEALYEVAQDPLIWEQHPIHDRYKKAIFTDFFRDSIASQAALVILDQRTGEVIGSSRFKRIAKSAEAIEIGWSFLSRKYWGGTYNKAMKSLMINHAFKTIHQVIFYIGTANVRSQKAVEKLGGLRITRLAYPEIVKTEEDILTYLITKEAWEKQAMK